MTTENYFAAPVTKSFQFGQHTVSLETARIARQADGAVMARMGDTLVLVAVTAASTEKPGQSFFPLTVEYQEKTYAAGRIPGGFFRREGRPSEQEILTARLTDRAIRPLFPKGFKNEVQVVVTVMSLDPQISADIVAMLGVSAALAISGLPFNGPIGAARVGYTEGQYVLNPGPDALQNSDLDLVVAGNDKAVLMVESEAKMLPEDVMLGAVMFGHREMQTAIQAINEFAAEGGKPKWDWQAAPENTELQAAVNAAAEAEIAAAYQMQDKMQRQAKLAELRDATCEKLVAADDAEGPSSEAVCEAFGKIEKRIVRSRILAGEARIDGRDRETVRPIQIDVGLLPRAHGSVVFTRGETQAIVAATMGTERDAQKIDALAGEINDRFMLHYNFPPYCVGETGRVGSPKRREIGHGRLARRSVEAVLPTQDEFPYVLRVVSEITESNGSSSMASVCGTTLALMDAGVPIHAPVAGIAMGLVKDGETFAVLTDILGDEDHLGDMDFKVAGTRDGITALQMDIKIDGITEDIMQQALTQARAGRLHILGCMLETLGRPRVEMSEHAPRITTLKVHPDKIRDIIGKGGATIRALTEETGATIDVNDDGKVSIFAVDRESGAEAVRRIEEITAEVEEGKLYTGKVMRIVEYGAFVNILPGRDGLLHISQIAHERIENVTDVLAEGQEVTVKVLEVDRQGRVRLSMKDVSTEDAAEAADVPVSS